MNFFLAATAVGAQDLFYERQPADEGKFLLQYFNLSQKIVVLRYLHCCFLRENSLIR